MYHWSFTFSPSFLASLIASFVQFLRECNNLTSNSSISNKCCWSGMSSADVTLVLQPLHFSTLMISKSGHPLNSASRSTARHSSLAWFCDSEQDPAVSQIALVSGSSKVILLFFEGPAGIQRYFCASFCYL